MANKSNNPVTIESYNTRTGRVKSIYTPGSIYEKSFFSTIVVLACIGIDLCCLFTTWDGVQMADPMVTFAIALACAIALDAPLAVAATALKRYHHKMLNFTEMLCIVLPAVIVFLIAFAFSFGMRMVTGESSFGESASVTLVDSSGASLAAPTSGSDDLIVRWASLFSGVVPLLTSITSFVVSYFSESPINNKLKVLETEKIGLDNNILEIDVAISQAEDAVTHCKRLLAREEDLYNAFLSKLDAEERVLKERFRTLLKEKMGSPEAITVITESSAELDNAHEEEHAPASLDFILNMLRESSDAEENITSEPNTSERYPLSGNNESVSEEHTEPEEPVFKRTQKYEEPMITAGPDIEAIDNTDEDSFAA